MIGSRPRVARLRRHEVTARAGQAQRRQKRILCFGDGNTHGTRAAQTPDTVMRYRSSVRWAGHLAESLGPDFRIIEEGQPGRTTVHDDPVDGAHKNGLRVLPALLETHRPVDAVILMVGTDDLKARFAFSADQVAQSVGMLANAVAASRAGPEGSAPRVVIAAPVPIEERGWLGEVYAGGAAKSRLLAARLAEVAARLGCGFLDAGAHGEVDPLDGVHLSPRGHANVAQAVARYCRTCLV